MTDNKITELTANTAPQPTDLLVMEDDPGGTPLTQKITIADFFKVINALTEETVMDTAVDLVVIYDASVGAVRKVKLTNLGVGGGGADENAVTSLIMAFG